MTLPRYLRPCAAFSCSFMAMACLSRLSMLLKYTLLSVMFLMALKEVKGGGGGGEKRGEWGPG